ncbi:MYND-type zinc finger protein samB [Trichophyton rubrum CBS 118892]|uniref:MYND-type zinc finger protein samB n=1 Tax=Trichophyton rubrum (strain ATCC MYA-4607 / CBS 118892) TaxID=559305 RepID=A0A080WW10_TRIRC|nr:MYND-type zinc finger protein samB [Trichophyton rubrum CBS 118892]KFL62243.1 MYND-type zinc finger protein samB [Trichophyton rubrum CBS 118892]
MREVNFSIPSVNKAAVNITTTLYDRRALDCTSTLPLINSLNHLAYLTTSSDRIRDILTVDGGIEQLCVVNIGVRGSENVRTRVVEADMVPVIATILDNYIRVVDRIRASSSAAASTDPDASRSKQHKTAINTTTTSTPTPTSSTSSSRRDQPPRTSRASFYDHRSDQRNARRQAPPPSIEIPLPYAQDGPEHNTATTTATTAATTATTAATEGRHNNNLHTPIDVQPSPHIVLTSPPERTTFNHHHHHHHQREGHRHRIIQPLASATVATAATTMTTTTTTTTAPTTDPFNPIRQVRDVDRLPSALPGLQGGITSQPESLFCFHTTTSPQTAEEAQEEMEEYILPDDFNIFPLVEKFTVRHHTKDMQYWACVVMRNLCRKDDSRGGIRQCAYYKCGKWEEFQRQFAKCRRCRRTKYCSKECQKSAWVYHRHWCHSSPEH